MIRASNLLRLQRCPGSHRLESQVPPEENDSPQAAEGRLLHGYSQNPKLDRSFLKPFQRDLLRIGSECISAVLDKAQGEGAVAVLNEISLEEPVWGHADWIFDFDNLRVVIDEKYGYKVVTPASGNVQLRSYAVGAHKKWKDDKPCLVAITQPRLPYGERITLSIYAETDFDQAEKEIQAIVAEAQKPDAPLNPGEEQCRYCTAKLICPAYQKILRLGTALVPLAVGTLTKRTNNAQELLATTTDEQLESILLAISFSDFIKDQARDEARARKSRDQAALPNYILGREGDTRKISDTKRAMSLLQLKGNLEKADVLDCAELHLGQLQDKLRSTRNLTHKQAREEIDTTLQSVIEITKKKPSLTRK